ncbi:NAC domain-containing protein 72-like [Syzygium oleosum]|uniref:NAC domain-containing protein 72-like n=1 Tax=Syzygium oleosum TaxID=219896 RepID=UPI0024B99492|nr:NAC domain-containing protein 72-like [Syzygium oleosum]
MADTLPIGCRFSPSDEQLFFYYLAHRVRGDLSFSGFIPEFDVYEKEPWKFFDEDADRSLYFFTKIKMKKSRAERTAGSGFWKGVKTTDIEDHQGNIVGHKKHFNFKAKDGSSFERENAAKGSWIMHEYSMLKQEIVLCKIRFKKEESREKQGTTIFLSMPVELEKITDSTNLPTSTATSMCLTKTSTWNHRKQCLPFRVLMLIGNHGIAQVRRGNPSRWHLNRA